MIIDKSTQFAAAQSVALAAGTALIGDVIDLTLTGDGIVGDPELHLVITVDTAIHTGGAAGTLQFKLSSDSAAAVGGTSPVDHVLTPAYATSGADIAAGTVLFVCELPARGANPYKRFLGILAVVATTAITQGKVNAFLTPDAKTWLATKDAVN